MINSAIQTAVQPVSNALSGPPL